jgi:hypothetical protein
MAASTRLVEVTEAEEAPSRLGLGVPEETARDRAESALSSLLMLNLKTLSQRAVIGLSSLTDLVLIGSAFALWFRTIDAPTPLQLIGESIYSLFVLVAIWARRK